MSEADQSLYHYTSAEGLAGIVRSKSFWASDYRFLNDSSEFSFGLKKLKVAIRDREREISALSIEAWMMIEEFLSAGVEDSTVAFVASLSRKGDLLSQWRGYNEGKGFCLGIDKDWLRANALQQGFALVPVLYEDSLQSRAAEGVVGFLLTMLTDAKGDPAATNEMTRKWWSRVLNAALAFKDAHFSEEDEMRLIYTGRSWPSGVGIRSARGGLLPYLPCFFNRDDVPNSILTHTKNCGLTEIILGPAAKTKQKFAVDALLASQHMRFLIRQSDIPYVAD